MRFNGVDIRSVHPAISIAKEIPPGTAERVMETAEGADGEIITGERLRAGEYIARVNIAGRTPAEGWRVRELLAGWACAPGIQTAALIPTHNAARCYDARIKSISAPEFVRGGAVVEMRFFLPRATARDVIASSASGQGRMTMRIGGTTACRPTIRQTIKAAQDGLTIRMDGAPVLTLTGALRAGQVVEMDTEAESVTIDGAHAESRIDPSGTRWRPGWLPGTHDITSTDGGGMEGRWHNEWL